MHFKKYFLYIPLQEVSRIPNAAFTYICNYTLYAAINEYNAAGRGRSYSGDEELDLDSLAALARYDLAKEYFLIAKEELDRLHKLYPDDKKIKETLLSLCNYPGVTLSNICPESEEKVASLFSGDEWTKKLSDFGNLKPLAKNTKKEGKSIGMEE